ncbi:MAG: TonB family protein [Opitutales bacterium]
MKKTIQLIALLIPLFCIGEAAPKIKSMLSLFHYIDSNDFVNGDYAVMQFTVLEDGSTSGIKMEEGNNERLAELAKKSIRQWTFYPETKQGQAVKSVVQQKVIIKDSQQMDFKAPLTSDYVRASCKLLDENGSTSPKIKKFVEPKYPLKLWRKGISGEATIEFRIDRDGSVSELSPVTSSHDEFLKSSIKALRKSRYEAMDREVLCRIQFMFVERGANKPECIREML